MGRRKTVETAKATDGPGVHRYPRKQTTYWRQSLGLIVLMLAAAGLESLLETGKGAGASFVELLLIAAGVTVAVAALVMVSWKQVYKYLASADAAVVVLVAIMLATILGTVVLQNVDEASFRAQYGSLAPLLLSLHVDDIFHSYPFILLLVLLAGASTITVWRRRTSFKKWRHMGLLVSHISVLLILIGGLVGSISGRRGMMHLIVGESGDRYQSDAKGHQPSEVVNLGFAVRLDRFELDHYDPEFKFYTYQKLADTDGYDLVSAEEPVVGETVGAGPKKPVATVKVTKLYHSITRGSSGGEKHELVLPGGERIAVAPGKTFTFEGRSVLIEKFVPDFVIDMEKGEVTTRSLIPNNPALVAKVTSGSETGRTFYLFGRRELKDNAHGGSLGIEYQYTAGESTWVDNPEGAPNPAAEVEIRHASGRVDTALLFAAQPQPINLGGERLLVYREKPEMIKNYRSTLTIVKDGRDVLSQEIKVNHPMFYEGFAFYQANFDPRNPSYSGIEVVKDPGLPIVTFGLWALIAGVFQTVAFRNWKPWWERRGSRAAHQGVEVAA